MNQAVTSWLQTLGIYFFWAGIQALVPIWYKCLNVNCDYAEVWCVPSATLMHVYSRFGIKSSLSDCPSMTPYFVKVRGSLIKGNFI